MRIMCLNGWGGKLYAELIAYVRAEAPDILCLQEVVHSPDSEKDWLTYRDNDHVLLQRANFFRDVCRALPDHVASFCPAAQGVLWDHETSVQSQWGLATFVRSVLPIIGQVQGFVYKDFGADGYGGHPRSRSAHGVRVFDAKSGRVVSVLHMHGLRDLAGKSDTPERATQARKLAAMAQGLAKPGDALVVCGDFNVEPNSEIFEVLREIGLHDLVRAHGVTDTRTSHYKKPGRFADYMLVNDTVQPVGFEVVTEPEVSDHRPLVLEM